MKTVREKRRKTDDFDEPTEEKIDGRKEGKKECKIEIEQWRTSKEKKKTKRNR